MDTILQGYLDDFRDDFSFDKEENSKLFEHFVNYCLIKKIDPDRVAIESVNVGGRNNPGIDGMAIIVNDHVVITKEQVDYFLEILGRLEVEFIFIQSKTTESFEMKEIGSFLTCVNEYFNKSTTMKFEEDLINLIEVKDYIYTKSIKFERNPSVKIFYATCGKYQEDKNVLSTVNYQIDNIKKKDIFSDVAFHPVDRDNIKKTYREIKNTITREINFEKFTIFPPIANVQESFIGILPGKEFIKLIIDDNDEILRNIFYDNVRDFQGFNSVNNDIKKTIEENNNNDKFSLCNNGVTIVARKLNKVGYKFIISDYQIVNGCQTSHVLYYLKNKISENIFIPIKLIITDNYEVTASIVKATNRQTEVKSEAFEILSPFHKKLEEFYEAMDKKNKTRIFYERRSHQYDSLRISRSNIITISNQISSFVSMFLLEPHTAYQRYYGELLKMYKSRIFLDEHSAYPYFISGLYLSAIEKMFQNGELPSKYKRFKYHIIMIARKHLCQNTIPPFNSHEIEKNSELMLTTIFDRKRFFKIIENIMVKIGELLNKHCNNLRNLHSLSTFTDELLGTQSKNKGTIIYYNENRGFGFLNTGDEHDVYFHITEYHKYYPNQEPAKNEQLYFDIVDSDDGKKAINLEYAN
jgi:cold shock CspA family protein